MTIEPLAELAVCVAHAGHLDQARQILALGPHIERAALTVLTTLIKHSDRLKGRPTDTLRAMVRNHGKDTVHRLIDQAAASIGNLSVHQQGFVESMHMIVDNL
jgi:hypothetical protein